MKLYTSIGPNPRVVEMYLAETGVSVERVTLDIVAGENRQPEYLTAINPMGQTPALVLEDGQVITETPAICRYLETANTGHTLFGETPEQRAEVDMWVRRMDLRIIEPMTIAFRGAEGYAMFKDRCHCLPTAADELKAYGQSGLQWLDGQLAGKQWLCGGRFSFADIVLYCFLDFFPQVNQPLDEQCINLYAWKARVDDRESARLTSGQ